MAGQILSELPQFSVRRLLIYALCLCSSKSTSISLTPLGMVSVCPGGQLLLTCERMSGSFLFWDVSVPRMAGATTQGIIVPASPRVVLSPDFNIGFTEFSVTRTSSSPLISQLLINNVTTEINGSTIYCSEYSNEKNGSMATVNVKYEDQLLDGVDGSLTITVVNQLLRSDDVTVTLQWPREPGAAYSVNVSPQTPHTELTNAMTIMIMFLITLERYNMSIVSSLCGVTITKVLNYADCGVPLVDKYLKLNYTSTLEGSVLTLTCENEISFNSTTETILSVTCHSNGNWIPNPADFIQSCSLFSTINIVSPTTDAESLVWTPASSILIAVCAIISIVFLSIGYACGWFSHKHKQSRTSKTTTTDSSVEENTSRDIEGSQLPPTPGPLYEELQQRSTPEHQDLVELKENVAYGPIVTIGQTHAL